MAQTNSCPILDAMFSNAIRQTIHPATWAVVGYETGLMGEVMGHRGTAFAVDQLGHLVTCWHVTFMDKECTRDVQRFSVVQPERDVKAVYPATLIARDKDADIAVLKIEKPAGGMQWAKMHGGETVRWGTSCCAFGHPLSIASKDQIRIFTRAGSGILSTPMLSPRFENCRPIRIYEVDFFTHGGMSGGPLFLRDGLVFGVVSGSRMLDGDNGTQVRSNLSIATDVVEVVKLLESLGIKPQLGPQVGRNVVPEKPGHGKPRRGGRR